MEEEPEEKWMKLILEKRIDPERFSVNIPFDVEGGHVVAWMMDYDKMVCITRVKVSGEPTMNDIRKAQAMTLGLLEKYIRPTEEKVRAYFADPD
jgi:hypothetical protein